MEYPARLPGHSGLSPANFTSFAHPADRTPAPEGVRWIKHMIIGMYWNDEPERSRSRSLLSRAIFVHDR
jgi:hypothetical protein